ncbi:hypothetical protein J4229_03180 [Candidatus Pacearchaeota archaeon]|nr:hypothetical protein [Candidatus Pacearchaeota archaeon]
MWKKGQIAIFVIIALAIVGAIIVIVSYPQISTIVSPKEISPQSYLSSCIEPDVKEAVEALARQFSNLF